MTRGYRRKTRRTAVDLAKPSRNGNPLSRKQWLWGWQRCVGHCLHEKSHSFFSCWGEIMEGIVYSLSCHILFWWTSRKKHQLFWFILFGYGSIPIKNIIFRPVNMVNMVNIAGGPSYWRRLFNDAGERRFERFKPEPRAVGGLLGGSSHLVSYIKFISLYPSYKWDK